MADFINLRDVVYNRDLIVKFRRRGSTSLVIYTPEAPEPDVIYFKTEDERDAAWMELAYGPFAEVPE